MLRARQPGPDGELYPGVFVVKLEVTANKTWAPVGADFQLELSDIDGGAFPDIDAAEHYNMKFMKVGRSAKAYEFASR